MNRGAKTADLQPESIGGASREVWRQMSPRRRRHFYFVLALIFLGALAELVTIGMLLPFLSLLAEPDRIRAIGIVSGFFDAVGAATPHDRVLAASCLFAATALAAGAVRLILNWHSQLFAFRLTHEIGVAIQQRMLHQNYSYHISTNSSEGVAALEKIEQLVSYVLQPIMQAITAIIIAVFIVAALIYISPQVALLSAAAFGAIYIVVSLVTRSRLSRNSKIVNQAFALRVQTVQEGLGAIRDIIIDKSYSVYVGQFEEIDSRFRKAQAINAFIGTAPRFIIEAAGMVLIAAITLILSEGEGGLAASLPVIGALALGAQRLLPLMQQIFFSWAYLSGNRDIVVDIARFLRLPMPVQPQRRLEGSFSFGHQIEFDKVSFAYASRSEAVVELIDLRIRKGARVALIGRTGSGKSTLLDLLMGLLEPTGGEIRIDGARLTGATRDAWHAQIAHVPQSIFLSDSTIERNIAFGVDPLAIDRQRVIAAARKAQLHDFVSTLPEGYDTQVGERGVRLSGGQRQRLGIARALYKAAPVLILDEATSALDDATEAAVMKSFESLGDSITIVMIAHRLSTIANFDTVVKMDHGRVAEVGSYADVVDSKSRSNIPMDMD